jgi:hypothetical protein
MTPTEFRHIRRAVWSLEEWTIAWDVCPKVRQSYGQSDRNVIEVADLIDRTPSAVSRAFGNLWGAKTNGRKGLRNYAGAAAEVVDRYGSDYGLLHSDALRIRSALVRNSLTPRIDIDTDEAEGLLPVPEIRHELRLRGWTRRYYFLYQRAGSLSEGIGFFAQNAVQLGSDLVQLLIWIDGRVRSAQSRSNRHEVTRSRAWIRFRDGRIDEVEMEVIQKRLPDLHQDELNDDGRHQLASFISLIKGLREAELPSQSPLSNEPRRGPGPGRKMRRISRLLGFSVARLCPSCIEEIDRLLREASSPGFRKAIHDFRAHDRRGMRRASQRSLDHW